jgi:hypothetical protein
MRKDRRVFLTGTRQPQEYDHSWLHETFRVRGSLRQPHRAGDKRLDWLTKLQHLRALRRPAGRRRVLLGTQPSPPPPITLTSTMARLANGQIVDSGLIRRKQDTKDNAPWPFLPGGRFTAVVN